jgi:mannose-6-phosphate isomerase-like protein (cupin superfamily)
LLQAGLCLTIPAGTAFQFRASATEPVAAVAVTMPPWPGEEEAVFVQGVWVGVDCGRLTVYPLSG